MIQCDECCKEFHRVCIGIYQKLQEVTGINEASFKCGTENCNNGFQFFNENMKTKTVKEKSRQDSN